MIISLRRMDLDNLGDQASAPVLYFEELIGAVPVDIHTQDVPAEARAVIVGGGGLLHEPWLEKLGALAATGITTVAWSIGCNVHGTTQLSWPDFLDRYTLVGCRDMNNPWHYVPCVSCLHPAFAAARQIEPQNPYVIYEHHALPIPVAAEHELRLSNKQPLLAFGNVLKTLASATTIVTNTWHGCYWGMLLERRVLCFKPFSNRFYGFKYPPVFCDETDWTGKLNGEPAPAGYLDECRALNLDFAARVFSLLKL